MKDLRLRLPILVFCLFFSGVVISANVIGTCNKGEWHRVFGSYDNCMAAVKTHRSQTGHSGTCR